MGKIAKGLSLLKRTVLEKGFRARLIYALMKHIVRVKSKTVLYDSYHSKSMTGNPYAIFLALVNDPRFDGFEHIWILNNPSLIDGWRNSNVKLVKRNSFRHAISLLSSKYLINNTTFASYVSKRDEQVYINTWHGTPIKTLGDDIAGSYGSGGNIARNILQVDYLVLPNRFTVDRILSSFNLSSIYPGKIIENGHPRIDLSFMTEIEKKGLRNKLNIPDGKKVILYAPTYRGELDDLKAEEEQVKEILEELHAKHGSKYAVLYKGHYFDNLFFQLTGVHSISGQQDTNELLGIVDVLVTDYSSIAFDFIPLERPIIYFSYDLDSYIRDRGLYFDLKEMPGSHCQSVASVLEEVEKIDQHMPRFGSVYKEAREKYCRYDDGSVTSKVVNTVFFGETKNVNQYQVPSSGKTKILLYGGGYLNNGVTSSLVSLLANIDYSKYSVTLISNSDTAGENFDRLIRNISDDVSLFYISNTTLRLFQPIFGWLNPRVLSRLFSNEYYALFGEADFDVAIDYSGYGTYWASLMAFSNSEKKCIYLHNDMKKEQEIRPELCNYNFIFSLYKNCFDKLITVSESGYHANCENFPALREKLTQVDNPIDAARVIRLSAESDLVWRAHLDEDKINFINIARYSTEKGQERLIDAFSQISEMYEDLHLYLVGHGDQYKSLEKQIIRLDLQEKITLTDNIENPFPLLSGCDCFVLSSYYEGQGLVLLESLVLGIPCISTDIPGPQSVLSEGKGLLVESSVEGLIQGMDMFMKKEVPQKEFNYNEYTKNAMSSFYDAIE
jgi:CDP-glycerol glycerophosphotransferase